MTVIIPRRFCGPPDSGNGGYTCAHVARALGVGPAEVTLRRPIPMETPMELVAGEGTMLLMAGAETIATGVDATFPATTSPTITYAQAEAAAIASPAFHNHPFPTCFVCGPYRGDGLRIFPGLVTDAAERIFAAPWIPAAEFGDAQGRIKPEFLWAALDCPTGFAAGFPWAGTLVTGRLAAALIAPVRAGERCVLTSWKTGEEGRKHHAYCVLNGEDGTVRAQARATWIKLP